MTEAREIDTAFTGRAWLVISGFLLVPTVIAGLYASAGRIPPPLFQILAWLGAGLLFAYFVRKDRLCLGARATLPDLGLLVLAAWPLVVPYHLFAMRGRRGWRPFLIFAAILLVAYVIEAVFYASYLQRVYPPLMRGE